MSLGDFASGIIGVLLGAYACDYLWRRKMERRARRAAQDAAKWREIRRPR